MPPLHYLFKRTPLSFLASIPDTQRFFFSLMLYCPLLVLVHSTMTCVVDARKVRRLTSYHLAPQLRQRCASYINNAGELQSLIIVIT